MSFFCVDNQTKFGLLLHWFGDFGAVGAWLFICELLAFERRTEKDKRSLRLFLVYVGCVVVVILYFL